MADDRGAQGAGRRAEDGGRRTGERRKKDEGWRRSRRLFQVVFMQCKGYDKIEVPKIEISKLACKHVVFRVCAFFSLIIAVVRCSFRHCAVLFYFMKGMTTRT